MVKGVVCKERTANLKKAVGGFRFVCFDNLTRDGKVLCERSRACSFVVYGMGYRCKVVEDMGIEGILALTHVGNLPSDKRLLVG